MTKKDKNQEVEEQGLMDVVLPVIPSTKKTSKKSVVEPGATTHTMAEGETLADVATRYGLSLKRLQVLNNVTGQVGVGEQLLVEAK